MSFFDSLFEKLATPQVTRPVVKQEKPFPKRTEDSLKLVEVLTLAGSALVMDNGTFVRGLEVWPVDLEAGNRGRKQAYHFAFGQALRRLRAPSAWQIVITSRPQDIGPYLERLAEVLQQCRANGTPTLLLGVSFALLDLAESFPADLSGITVMETGGMKGRRKELTRLELHETLRQAFRLDAIHSEYGMTELFSQAYSTGGRFVPAGTMRVVAKEANDPFALAPEGRTGVLNIVDLANLDTCSFIATEDLGKVYADGSFEVLGRLDVAEMRGCNLMVE